MEEYELLFPFTAECRKKLCDRHGEIQDYLHNFIRELQNGFFESIEQREAIINKAYSEKDILADQMGLMQDLLVHLQNYCLSKFSGYELPARKPGDPSVPRVVKDDKGMLQIIIPQNSKTNEQR